MKAGTLIGGKYHLKRQLGRGQMGEVWAAVNRTTEGEVALKLLMPGADPEVRRRLLREAKACGRLKHRTIVEIYDVGETEQGEPFLVMQLLHGETLAQRLKRVNALPVEVAVGFASDVALALRHAHEKNIVHRDLKPANIFLHQEPDTEGTQTKVVDFGVSKLAIENEGESAGTMAGSLLGSPAYMSPEQARGAAVDGRSDLWALGILLFEMLAGRRPFTGQTAIQVIAELHGKGPIVRVETMAPHVNPRLGDVIAACLARSADERVPSAAELLRLLRPFGPREPFGTHQSGAHQLGSSWTDAREIPVAPVVASPAPRLPPPVVPARRVMAERIAPPPVIAPSRESVTGLFQPHHLPLPAPPEKDEPSGDSMDETIMRPALAPAPRAIVAPPAPSRAAPPHAAPPHAAPPHAAPPHAAPPRATQPLAQIRPAPAPPPPAPLAAEPDAPSRDSMDAPTGMFNPRALLEPLYSERESNEPTGRHDPTATAILGAHDVPYVVSESSRPTSEIAAPAPKVSINASMARAPGESAPRAAQASSFSAGAQDAIGGTLPMQPGLVPRIRAAQGADDPSGDDWKKRTVPLESPFQPDAVDWKKRTVPLKSSFSPASPSAPEWRRQNTFDPASSPGLPDAATAQWQPSPLAHAATSTSPVSRPKAPELPPPPGLVAEPPRTSSTFMLLLIVCSVVVVLSSGVIVAVTIQRERAAAASGAASASAVATAVLAASAAPSAREPGKEGHP